MEYTTFARRPFKVQAALVTTENIAELASKTGELKHKGDGTPYIQVDRDKLPGVLREILPGFWVCKTKKGSTGFRVYSPRIFNEQFVSTEEPMVADAVAILTNEVPAHG